MSEGQQGKGKKKKKENNGWKLAARAGDLGMIDHRKQWAKNKTKLPFVMPPTEDDVYLSSDSDKEDEGRGHKSPAAQGQARKYAIPVKSAFSPGKIDSGAVLLDSPSVKTRKVSNQMSPSDE